MGAGTLTVKKKRRDVHHVTFTENGPESHQMRWVIRGEPVGPTVDAVIALLKTLPEGTRVYIAYWREQLHKDGGTLTMQVTARFQAEAAALLLEITAGVSKKCQEQPNQASDLAERFCKAAYQVYRDDPAPLAEFVQSVGLMAEEYDGG